jgi:uncharacterized protein (TIGR00730 family)
MTHIQSIGVYCSSYQTEGIYAQAAQETGALLAHHRLILIYGGGTQGLMGKVVNAVLDQGGRAIGMMPRLENPQRDILESQRIGTMRAHKHQMFKHADAFFILPGGFGTLDEAFELLIWCQLKIHAKPIIFININNYWDPLKALMKNIFDQGFAKPEDRNCCQFVDSVQEAFQVLGQGTSCRLLQAK